MSVVTVIIEPEQGGRFTGRIQMRSDDWLGFEAFASAGPRREFQFGGPYADAFWVGDRVRITIPEYEFSDSGRVVSWSGMDTDGGSTSAVVIRTPADDALSTADQPDAARTNLSTPRTD